LVKSVDCLVRAAGFATSVEDRCAFSARKLRTDITVYAFQPDGSDLSVDVAVVNPAADSYLPARDVVPLSAAVWKANAKTQKYQAILGGSSFCPAVWEAYGAVGESAQSLVVKSCARLSQEDDTFSPPNWAASSPSSYWWQRLSVALQRSNARKMRDLLSAAARK